MKRIASFALTALFAAQIFAVDFGAMLSTNTDFKFDGNEYSQCALEQSETLNPYLKVYFGNTSYIAAELSIKHKLTDTLGADQDAENEVVLDLSLLKFSNTIKFDNAQTLEFAIGRMYTIDSTGIVFAQPSDGILLKYASQNVELGFYAGYTGLLNIKNVDILSSTGDLVTPSEDRILYDFAAPYIVAMLSVNAPYLFANQTLFLEALGAIPSAGPNALPDGEKNRIYATLGLNGPITPELFYTLSATLQTNDFSDFALLGNLGVKYFLPVFNSTVGLSAVYASGENGGLKPFVGFSKQTACRSTEEPGYSGILKAGLNGTMMPTDSLLLALGIDAVFAMAEKTEYYGLQAALSAQWNIFSDLQVSLGASTFIGKEESSNRTEIVIGGKIAF